MKGTTQHNVPSLRFPEFSGKWEIKKIGEVTEKINSGKTPLGGESVYLDRGILFIRSQNINNNMLCLENSKFISEELNNTMKNSIVKANDILLNITGASLGRSCVVPTNFEIGNVNQHVCIVRVKEDNNPNFIQIIFSSDFGQNTFSRLQTGSGREGLNFQNIKSLYISFPLLNEQKKIAHFFTIIDERLQILQKQKDHLEQYKKGMMQRLFSQSLRFKDEDGLDYPDWMEKKLGEIGKFQTSSIDKITKEDENEVFLVNYMDVYKHKSINNKSKFLLQVVSAKENQIESCNLKKGDILFTPSSETPNDIGHSVVVFEDLENTVFSYHLMRFRPNVKIDILYSHYFCNIPNVLNQLSKLATGSTRFTISVKSFSSIEIQLPSLPEQTKIANFLSEIDAKIANVQAQVVALQQWKKGLMQRMFV